jgi:hypothetical protein
MVSSTFLVTFIFSLASARFQTFQGGIKSSLSTTETLASRPYPLFMQCDPKWANNSMGVNGNGERSTICGEGCAMSCLSMVIAGCNIEINGSPSTPATLNSFLEANNGYICDAGDCNNLVLNASEKVDPRIVLIGESPLPPYEFVANAIATGEVAFLAHRRICDSGGCFSHFVLLTEAIGNGNFSILDPYYPPQPINVDSILDVIMYNISQIPSASKSYLLAASHAGNRARAAAAKARLLGPSTGKTASKSYLLAASHAGNRARAAAAKARLLGPSTGKTASNLPLLSSGTHLGAQYSAPADQIAANATDLLYSELLQKGGNLYQASIPWADIEVTPGSPNYVLIAEILNGAKTRNLIPLFQISVIDTEHAAVPSDLADPTDPTRLRPDLEWNSTILVDRYALLLEVVVPIAAYSGAVYIGVGNEVDVNLEQHPETGYAFAEFLYIMKSFIQSLTSINMAVGVTLTVGGLNSWASPNVPPEWAIQVRSISDVNPLTYYPLQGNAHVITDQAAIQKEVSSALSFLLPTDSIVFQEFGIPTGYCNASSTNGSNQSIQAAFFTLFSQIMKLENKTRPVRALSLYQLVDMDDKDCEGLARYYNVSEPAFIEYLCTLGVLKNTGKEKEGWKSFLSNFLV